MHKKTVICAGAAAMLALGTMSVTANAAGPHLVRGPDGVKIELASNNGSGCPRHSVYASLHPDAESFRLSYSQYTAQAGADSTPVQARSNCQVSLNVQAPQELTYAILWTDHYGEADLVEGAEATYKISTYFSKTPPTTVTYRLGGPYKSDWWFKDRPPEDQLVFKPCGEEPKLNINSELRVNKGTSDPSKVSWIGIGSESTTTYHLVWKRCP
jgi:hypothetical protein